MQLNLASETAVRVLVRLARCGEQAPLPVRDLCDAVGGSPAYLAKIVGSLVRGGLLSSHRGAQGGVTLAREASAITLLEIVQSVQGVIGASYCSTRGTGEPVCGFHNAMREVRDAMVALLSRWTLKELAAPGPRHATCKVLLRGEADDGSACVGAGSVVS